CATASSCQSIIRAERSEAHKVPKSRSTRLQLGLSTRQHCRRLARAARPAGSKSCLKSHRPREEPGFDEIRREWMCGRRHPIDFFKQHAPRNLVTFRTRSNTSCTVDECVSDRPSCIRPLGLGLRKEYEKLTVSSSEIAGERAIDQDDGGSDRPRRPAASGSVA